MTPQAAVTNIDGEYDKDVVSQINNPPSAKAAQKIREKNRENAESVMAKTSKALGSINCEISRSLSRKKNIQRVRWVIR